MSALARDPGKRRQQQAAQPQAGAMAADPNPGRIQARIDWLKKNRPNDPQIGQLQQKLGQPGETAPGAVQGVADTANEAVNTAIGQMTAQGPFNPTGLPELNQDYGAARQRAEQMAMDSFNRRMEPQLQQQRAEFEQRMASQGVDAGSERYQRELGLLQQGQNDARQQAMTGAFQAGGAEQAQAFGQALAGRGQMFNEQFQGYQLPMAQLNALAPYSQQGFMGQQNQMDRDLQIQLAKMGNKFALQQIAATPRGGGGGGGGLSYEQQLGLLDRKMFNDLVSQGMMNGQQMPSPGVGGGIAQGIGTGVGIGLGAGLR